MKIARIALEHTVCDSSVLVKYHVPEVETPWVRQVLHVNSGNDVVTARISIVEVIAAFNRRVRETSMNIEDYQRLRDEFDAMCTVVEITLSLTNIARRCSKRIHSVLPTQCNLLLLCKPMTSCSHMGSH